MSAPRIPLADVRMDDDDLAAAAAVLGEGRLAPGERVQAFEREFAELVGARHAVATASCTAALHLAYRAVGVGPGDEVIVPAITFVASAGAAIHCGGVPVLADVVGDADIGLDPEDVQRRITGRTRAVCAVHYAGYPAAVGRLRELCDAHGLALVEDVAHGPLGDLDGRPLGTWGEVGCFSFFSNKVLSVGEGGALVTDDETLAARAREDRAALGYELDELRAGLLGSRLRRVGEAVARRRELTLRYRERLATIAGLVVPYRDEDVARSSCYAMPVVLEDAARRDGLAAALRSRHGIQTSVLYPAVNRFTAYVERYGRRPLPRAERVADAELTLPLHEWLATEQQDEVLAALEEELCG